MMVCRIVIGIVLICGLWSSGPLWAQNTQAHQLWQNAQKILSKNPKKALKLYQQAYDEALRTGQPDYAASICVDISTVYYLDDQYAPAIATCRQGLGLEKKYKPLSDTTRFKLFASLGEMFHQETKPDSTRRYWNLAEAMLEQIPKIAQQTPLYVAAYFGNRALWATEQSDYGLAETYLRERISLLSKAQSVRSRATAENQLALLYWRTTRFAEAERLFLASLDHYSTRDITRGWLLVSAVDFYIRQQRPDSAQTFLQQATRIRNNFAQPNLEFDRYLWQKWGQYYLQQAQWTTAETYLRRTLALGAATSKTGTLPSSTWRLVSQLAARRQQNSKALAYAQAAIEAVGNGFSEETDRPALDKVINGPGLIQALRWKADLWHQIALQEGNPTALQRAIRTYQQTFWLTEQCQWAFQAEISKLFLQQEIRPAFQAGLAAVYQQWTQTQKPADLRLFLQVQEQSKAAILAEQQPAHVGQAQLAKPVSQLIDPMQLRSRLPTNAALLHYSLTTDGLLLTVLRSSMVNVISLPITYDRLRVLCDSLQQMIDRPSDPFPYDGNPVAYQLYRALFAPALPALTGISRLIVVRDGMLHRLPFEVLETRYQPGSYLLRRYAIGYAYSGRTALGPQLLQPRTTPLILSMAPFAPDATTLPILQQRGYDLLDASRAEVSVSGGTISLGENASKQEFLELVSRHNLIHLATHAQSNPNPAQSCISFFPSTNDHRLYAHEIARLPLAHLRLAVLSACQTGAGRVHDSEGQLSLARAFAQAGCPAVLTSLWKVNDVSTTRLSALFYEQLRQGQPVDVALRQAKLAFLETEGNVGGFAPPFYWAHLILMGQNNPIYPPPVAFDINRWPERLILLLGLVGVGLGGRWISRRVFSSQFATVPATGPGHEADK
jgi:CHAT domain-containing protein